MFNLYTATPDGHFVSDKHMRIAEIIKDYDPDLELVWIPPENRLPEDNNKEFAVTHRLPGKNPYIVFYVSADEVDERVLARLWSADNGNGSVLNKIDAMNAAVEAVKLKEQMDYEEERSDLVKHILKSPRATYRHNGVVYE